MKTRDLILNGFAIAIIVFMIILSLTMYFNNDPYTKSVAMLTGIVIFCGLLSYDMNIALFGVLLILAIGFGSEIYADHLGMLQ